MKELIYDKLKSGRVEEALGQMSIQNNNARLILLDYLNEKMMLTSGLIDEASFLLYEKNIIKRTVNLLNEPDDIPDMQPAVEKASVFLSYNHGDLIDANRIADELNKYAIRTRMDQFDVLPGQAITSFIVEQIKKSKAVMILLSRNSLRSSWVIHESTMALFNELLNNKSIIPVALDDSYLDDNFSLEAHAYFEEQRQKKNEIIDRHKQIEAGYRHIQSDLNRIEDAKNRFATFLDRLRAGAVCPIDGPRFESNLKRIAETIINGFVEK